ncbi:MAG: branched-chain amino acid ABC transporter permease [Ferrovum sp. 21-44-67]|uniref:branched-chain amino acid ABC transporter permease n=1 Tax=Ferrovum sp. JA12 TaxID=1356299 RepID=UPI00070296C3|nr:MAG: branched-chain amino acid ABC transporter permease [Ferrovum sp. 21-44-67]
MMIFWQQVINGLTLGSIYALVALGYTMVYGIMELINFAHGDVVMIGALIALSTTQWLMTQGFPLTSALIVAFGLSVFICMILGYLIEKVAYRPLRSAPKLAPLITAIGLSLLLQQLASLIWGKGYLPFPGNIGELTLAWHGLVVSTLQLSIFVLSLLFMLLLWQLIHHTKLGRAMRATAQSVPFAQLMGVNTDRVISQTFILGSALAAVAGVMDVIYYSVGNYTMGFLLGLKAFTAAVLGGIGNLKGAMLGGVLLGVVEALGAGYIGDLTHGLFGSNYKDVFAFFVLILVLIFKPNGLLGGKTQEKV